MKIASFFSGAGGLDLGFEKAGFDIVWANEFDKKIWATFEHNFPNTILDKRSITHVPSEDVPDVDGIVGGPPCQSWSEAGALKGLKDKRGQLFFEFIRILKDKQPKFFLAENVSGMLAKRHSEAIELIKQHFRDAGYDLFFEMLNANDYNVPQDRKRVFFIGFRRDLKVDDFEFPKPNTSKPVLKDILKDISESAVSAFEKNYANSSCSIPNHEYFIGGFSSMYMSRNRVRSWEEPSFTIQAGGRHAPIHPQAPKMKKLEPNKQIFQPGEEDLYRRLTVRECARIQTFPDTHIFKYDNVGDGYKMVGNAVPVNLAKAIASTIKVALITTPGY